MSPDLSNSLPKHGDKINATIKSKFKYRGYFDSIVNEEAVGWAYNGSLPQDRMTVELICDGEVVARGLANQFRKSLLTAGIGDGLHQFRIRLPRKFFDGNIHAFHARIASGEFELSNSPQSLQEFKEPLLPSGSVIIDADKAKKLLEEAKISITKKKWLEAESALKESLTLNSTLAEAWWMLSQALDKIGRTWESTDALGKAVTLNPKNEVWYYIYATFLERMNRFEDAVNAYRASIKLKPGNSEHYYRLGHALEKWGMPSEANKAYIYAAEYDATGLGRQFGPGVWHAERGLWSDAVFAYEKHAIEHSNAELYYRLGMAYDRCYRWQDAVEAYRHAISLDATQPDWHYRLGFVLERSKDWLASADAYKAALARQEDFNSEWYYRLGYVLTNAGCHAEANVAYRWTRILGRPYGVDASAYDSDKGFKPVSEYIEYYEMLPIQEEAILYESYHGASMGCNPYALFKYILQQPDFSDWMHVWIINDKTRIPSEFKHNLNIVFIKKDCDLYRRYLASAKYLINNSTFPYYFMRRPEQIYLNTWHGTPLKTLGKDIKSSFLEHKNTARNFLHATHMISPNAHTTNVLLERNDISGIFPGLIAETGYPRNDLTLNADKKLKSDLRIRLNIASASKVVLYAPTFRGKLGNAKFEVDKVIRDINILSKNVDFTLLFRGHYFVEEKIRKELPVSVRIAPQDIDTNELLSIVDLLITDYSSIFFDFMPTSSPIIHYIDDLDEYKQDRGLYFPMEEMPGEICNDIIEVKFAVQDLLGKIDWKPGLIYLQAREKFCHYEDGHATKRVFDFLFKEDKTNVLNTRSDKISLLLFEGPFMPNGITSSFINLCKNLDRSKYNPVVVLDTGNMESYPERMDQFDLIVDTVQVVGRVGRMNRTPEDRWLDEAPHFKNNGIRGFEIIELERRSYNFEYYRMFGLASFSAAINFEGYSKFWGSIFAYGPPAKVSKSVYLHNELYSEWKLKLPSFSDLFRLYSNFDHLVSVAENVNETNCSQLSDLFSVDKDKFVYCNNSISPEYLYGLAAQPDNDACYPWQQLAGSFTFCTIGRFSPEKDHTKLIRAMRELCNQRLDVHLVILGSGPSQHELEILIIELGLQSNIHLLGQKKNPFPYLVKSDCFVLSSNHEGQPMVILEALTLGKPVISTDIPGPRNLLQNGYGHLVENSVDGLVRGLSDFLDNKLSFRRFDPYDYQKQAMEMFYKKICGR